MPRLKRYNQQTISFLFFNFNFKSPLLLGYTIWFHLWDVSWPVAWKLVSGCWKLFTIYSCYLWSVLWGNISISLLFFPLLTTCSRNWVKLASELGRGFGLCICHELGRISVYLYCSELLLVVGGCVKEKAV